MEDEPLMVTKTHSQALRFTTEGIRARAIPDAHDLPDSQPCMIDPEVIEDCCTEVITFIEDYDALVTWLDRKGVS